MAKRNGIHRVRRSVSMRMLVTMVMPMVTPLLGLAALPALAEPPATVDAVDIERYMGRWYEIAALPNFFQRHCVRDTTADYRLRGDGLIDVVNRCEKGDGTLDEARGIARTADPETNAKLEVSFVRVFGMPVFWGDYWIIGLGADYDYALVGTPSRRWGWILARDPNPPAQRVASWLQRFAEQGYDPKAFVATSQSKRATAGDGR